MYWPALHRVLSLFISFIAFSMLEYCRGLSDFRGCGGGLPRGRLGSLLSLTSAANPGTKENWLQRLCRPKVEFTSLLQRREVGNVDDTAQNSGFSEDVFGQDEPTRLMPPIATADGLALVNDDENRQEIRIEELREALEKARGFVCDGSCRPSDDICRSGWSLVHESPEFHLFKRCIARSDGSKGPIEYLMTGSLSDISPFSFLAAQIHRSWRSLWDNTMKEMSQGTLYIKKNHCFSLSTEDTNTDADVVDAGCHISPVFSSDKLYYRTKWPWPLQDRDYSLVRRCRIFPDENAFVLVSRSTQVLVIDRSFCFSRCDSFIRAVGAVHVAVGGHGPTCRWCCTRGQVLVSFSRLFYMQHASGM